MSKSGGPENGFCDAHTEANIEMLLVSITEDFYFVTSERMGLLTILIRYL